MKCIVTASSHNSDSSGKNSSANNSSNSMVWIVSSIEFLI